MLFLHYPTYLLKINVIYYLSYQIYILTLLNIDLLQVDMSF